MRLSHSGSMRLVLTAIMLLWASIVVTPAKAASVKYFFSGQVETIGSNLLGPDSALGKAGSESRGALGDLGAPTVFDGFYIFDPTVAPSTMISTNVAQYSNTISQFHFTIHGDTTLESVDYQSTTTSPAHTVDVGNGAATPYAADVLHLNDPPAVPHDPFPADSYTVILSSVSGNTVVGALGASFNPSSLEFNFIHNNNIIPNGPFNSTNLPVTPPGLNWVGNSAAPEATLRVIFSGGEGSVIDVRINDIHLVATPLPPAVILFGAGLVSLIGLGARNWRQRKDGLVAGTKD